MLKNLEVFLIKRIEIHFHYEIRNVQSVVSTVIYYFSLGKGKVSFNRY